MSIFRHFYAQMMGGGDKSTSTQPLSRYGPTRPFKVSARPPAIAFFPPELTMDCEAGKSSQEHRGSHQFHGAQPTEHTYGTQRHDSDCWADGGADRGGLDVGRLWGSRQAVRAAKTALFPVPFRPPIKFMFGPRLILFMSWHMKLSNLLKHIPCQ